eukprot:scaffold1623_cov161-Prasinococcus_capsulatus_cf.AAC.1
MLARWLACLLAVCLSVGRSVCRRARRRRRRRRHRRAATRCWCWTWARAPPTPASWSTTPTASSSSAPPARPWAARTSTATCSACLRCVGPPPKSCARPRAMPRAAAAGCAPAAGARRPR